MGRKVTVILGVVAMTGGCLVLLARDGPGDPAPPASSARANGPQGHPQRMRPLTEEQEKELLAFLKEHRPDLHSRLTEMRDSKDRRYRWAIAPMWRWYLRYKRLPAEERDVELKQQDVRVKILRLLRAIREEKDAAKAEQLKKMLREAVTEQIEIEQKAFAIRLARLEEQVKRLREQLKGREQRRDQIIEERYQRLLEGGALRPLLMKRPRPSAGARGPDLDRALESRPAPAQDPPARQDR